MRTAESKAGLRMEDLVALMADVRASDPVATLRAELRRDQAFIRVQDSHYLPDGAAGVVVDTRQIADWWGLPGGGGREGGITVLLGPQARAIQRTMGLADEDFGLVVAAYSRQTRPQA